MMKLLLSCLVGLLPVAHASGQELSDTEITAELVRSVEAGLEYLARTQQADGSWIGNVGYKLNQSYNVMAQNVSHVGVTALAGMAFLAGGHLPDRGRYGDALEKCIEYVLAQVNDLGFITAHRTRMYSHAFATLFLAEVYGMTNRADVRQKLQRSVDLIVHAQNEQGSWRYEPFALESDMSITVCQLMALRAARNIGIKVNSSTIDRAVMYVRDSLVHTESSHIGRRWINGPQNKYYRSGPGAFRYQEEADARSSFALTAAGVTSLYHAAQYDFATLRESLNFMESTQRLVSSHWRGHYFYYYGHYYAVQAMFITGGQWWTSYWRTVSRELLDDQQSDGKWENYTGPGPQFGTAVALIVLQVPFRYLPILQR